MEELKQKGTLIKIIPIKQKIDNENYIDSVLYWYRDENGVKKSKFVERAKVPFYILKDKTSDEAINPPMFIEKDKVDKKIVYSDMLFREIAIRTGSTAFYDEVISKYPVKRQASNLKNLLKHNYIYDADMDIADRYIKYFNEEFEPDTNYKLKKVFFDIEVELAENGLKKDSQGHIGYMGFPDEDIAPCPVNIITIIDGTFNNVYTLLVRNHLNKLQEEFLNNLENEVADLKNQVKDEDDFNIGKLEVLVYDTEKECIESFFDIIHNIDPDFALAWNEGFDVCTLLNRLERIYNKDPETRKMGLKGRDRMITAVCDKTQLIQKNSKGEDVYLSPFSYYTKHPEQSIVDRMDTFHIFDSVMWLDQMLVFANIRKTTSLRESYSLDAIANEELGKEKLDYTGYTLKTLPWLNYKKFFKYNIKDVILLALLEKKNLDIEMIQRLSEITNTRKEKVFKKTISLKNFVCKFAEQQGFVMGNNKNAQYGDEGTNFENNYLSQKKLNEVDKNYIEVFKKKENYGAYVGDPNLNDYEGVNDASGKSSMFIFENVFDEDFSSLYPSIIRAYNLDKNTQIGKFFLLDPHIKNKLVTEYGYDGLFQTSKNEEASADSDSVDDIGPTLVDSLVSQDWGKIGEKYFDLPSTEDIIDNLLKGEKHESE